MTLNPITRAYQEKLQREAQKAREELYGVVKNSDNPTNNSFGFMNPSTLIRHKQKIEATERAIYKRRHPILSNRNKNNFATGFRASIKSIGKSIPVQRQRRPIPQRQVQQPQRLRPFEARLDERGGFFNPFEHQDPSVIFQDDFSSHDGEMLAFFDANKGNKSRGRTGNLFGF